jgi:hypothetical protein
VYLCLCFSGRNGKQECSFMGKIFWPSLLFSFAFVARSTPIRRACRETRLLVEFAIALRSICLQPRPCGSTVVGAWPARAKASFLCFCTCGSWVVFLGLGWWKEGSPAVGCHFAGVRVWRVLLTRRHQRVFPTTTCLTFSVYAFVCAVFLVCFFFFKSAYEFSDIISLF